MTRNVVIARVNGAACLCGVNIRRGDEIVKRWNQWIHLACYIEIQEAKGVTTQ